MSDSRSAAARPAGLAMMLCLATGAAAQGVPRAIDSGELRAMAAAVQAAAKAEQWRAQRRGNDEGQRQRAGVRYGAASELGSAGDYAWVRRYENAAIGEVQKQAVRAGLAAAIRDGTLLAAYDRPAYAERNAAATWATRDPLQRWKTCEVAGALARAHVFGDFAGRGRRNPMHGAAIAQAGYAEQCGAAAYWYGRMIEAGDSAVPGFDKAVLFPLVTASPTPFALEQLMERIYGVAIINGVSAAYERMAELYRTRGPARFAGKKFTYRMSWLVSGKFHYWNDAPDHTRMYLMKVQYTKCLVADPANLTRARGLRGAYSDPATDLR
ncbi:hypothetical protein [Massilia glaciei]|uniref:Sel1 repeat family protein n=1 Tax=Massilia glaciei TaxID=1524097 RepID=A0A2U2HNJ4_9BURK|nr:hypothetical protein [Massilia glaciei]PWF49081.1 hypothetical protein C7C56_008515 [Massilia glaciei]